MNMRRLIITVLAVFAIGSAQAEDSYYFLKIKKGENLGQLVKKIPKGSVIKFTPGVATIAKLCEFSKPVFASKSDVTCIYSGAVRASKTMRFYDGSVVVDG